MKLIIAGSRSFKDYYLLKSKVDSLLVNIQEEIEIVSGTANGADKLGERYAKEKGYKISQFPADWDKEGKRAGFIRNKKMAKYATHCIVFWDCKSLGTESMIKLANENKLPLRIITF